MRVLFYGLNFEPELTGIGKYSGEMVNWLVEHGHDVDVVTAPPYYPEWAIHEGYSSWSYRREEKKINSGHLRIIRCPLWVPRKVSGKSRLLHLASFAASSFPAFLWRLFAQPDLVVLVVPSLACAPIVAAFGRTTGARTWLHIQDFEVDAAFSLGIVSEGWFSRFALSIESFLLRRFDRVSSISARMVERLFRKGVTSERARLLPNWANLYEITPSTAPSPFRSALGLSEEAIVLLYSGNMGEKQGLEILVDLARLASNDKQLTFVFAGEGAARQRIMCSASDVTNILWLPLQPVEKLNDLLNLADIHLLPQRGDAADLVMPSKLTGMLASGKPVVGTAESGTQLGSVLEEVGIRVSPGDSGAFHQAVCALATNPAMRKKLGERSRQYAERNMCQNLIMTSFIDEVSELLTH